VGVGVGVGVVVGVERRPDGCEDDGMIVLLSPDAAPTLGDVDRLDRLHADSPGPLGDMMTGSLCRFDDDDEHVWIDIAAARAAGAEASDDGAWPARYDGMIAYATSKGWTDDADTHVRAHVERTDGAS
jgi:hypothetical protein